jgi:hypothetical protein
MRKALSHLRWILPEWYVVNDGLALLSAPKETRGTQDHAEQHLDGFGCRKNALSSIQSDMMGLCVTCQQ